MEPSSEAEGRTDAAERDDPAITSSVTCCVLPDREREFEGFLRGITEAASCFPGFRGARVIRPVRGNRHYRVVVRFDRESNVRRWKASEERRAWNALADECSEDEAAYASITGTGHERPLALVLSPRTASSGPASRASGSCCWAPRWRCSWPTPRCRTPTSASGRPS
jgi:antibiotic biosynthesis monooxygenase (ABM) superfamily enzyme